jgi:hypothetical protein
MVSSAATRITVRSADRRIMKLPRLIALLLIVSPLWAVLDPRYPDAAQIADCDKQLEQPVSNPNGYRLRGDRCEGVFVQEVAGTPLVIASFTARFDQYDVRAVQSLDIGWSAPTEGPMPDDAISRPRGPDRVLYAWRVRESDANISRVLRGTTSRMGSRGRGSIFALSVVGRPAAEKRMVRRQR